MKTTYTADVERCSDTGLYVGFVPGFPGAHTQGETLDELNSNLREVVEMRAEDLVGPRWAEWYALTPAERTRESSKLWPLYLALGGSLDPEPDTQSPFFDAEAQPESAPRAKDVHSHGAAE